MLIDIKVNPLLSLALMMMKIPCHWKNCMYCVSARESTDPFSEGSAGSLSWVTYIWLSIDQQNNPSCTISNSHTSEILKPAGVRLCFCLLVLGNVCTCCAHHRLPSHILQFLRGEEDSSTAQSLWVGHLIRVERISVFLTPSPW